MCESSKARRPDTEWVPGALLPGLSGRTTESAALHPYPIGGTVSLYGLFSPCTAFPVRVIPRRQLADAASCTIRRRPYGGIAPRGALLRGVSTRGKSPRKSACEVIMGSTMSSYLDRKRPLPLSKSLPRAAYRTAVRSFLLYHFF